MYGPIQRLLRSRHLYPLVPLFLTLVVHYPVVFRLFFRDDYIFLFEDSNLDLFEFALKPRSGHSLITWSVVFHFLHETFGLNPAGYYAFLLLLHLVNVLLVFSTIRIFTGRPSLAALGATMWGCGPIHFNVVGWIGASGIILATTFLLLIVREVARAAESSSKLSAATLLAWGLLLFAAATSFGTGLAVAVGFAVPAWLLLREHPDRLRALRTAVICSLLLPALYLLQHQWFGLHGAEGRLDLLAVVSDQSIQVASFFVTLLGYGASNLFIGLPLTGQLPGNSLLPRATLEIAMFTSYVFGAILLGVVVWALLRATRRGRGRIVAMLFMVGVSYATLAVARLKVIDEMGWPLAAIAVFPRYHYLAQAMIAIAFCLVFFEITSRAPRARRLWEIAIALWLLISIPFSAAFTREATPLGKAVYDSFQRNVARLESAIREAPKDKDLVIPNLALEHFTLAKNLFPKRAAIFVIVYPENTVDGRAIYFQEEDEQLLKRLLAQQEGRIREVLIGPTQKLPTPRHP